MSKIPTITGSTTIATVVSSGRVTGMSDDWTEVKPGIVYRVWRWCTPWRQHTWVFELIEQSPTPATPDIMYLE